MKKGIIIKFDKENERKFYDDWNKEIDCNLLVISLLETLNDICKYYNLDIKQQMEEYLELGSCDDYMNVDDVEKLVQKHNDNEESV